MATSCDSLHTLADKLRDGNPEVLGEFQEQLHPGLFLVIRSALRTGVGGDALQRWLGRALDELPHTEGVDPSGALARMLGMGLARLLSSRAEPGAISSAETVVL